jgi:hypothetical protein
MQPETLHPGRDSNSRPFKLLQLLRKCVHFHWRRIQRRPDVRNSAPARISGFLKPLDEKNPNYVHNVPIFTGLHKLCMTLCNTFVNVFCEKGVEFDLLQKNNCSLWETLPCDWEVRGYCMCKEMPVIPVNRVVDPKRKAGKNGGPRRRRGTRGLWPPPPPPKRNKYLVPLRDLNQRPGYWLQVLFNGSPAPSVTKLTLNTAVLCSGAGSGGATTTTQAPV